MEHEDIFNDLEEVEDNMHQPIAAGNAVRQRLVDAAF